VRLLVCGELNGHVRADVDEFEGVHAEFGFGSHKIKSQMLLEFCDAMILAVANSMVQERR